MAHVVTALLLLTMSEANEDNENSSNHPKQIGIRRTDWTSELLNALPQSTVRTWASNIDSRYLRKDSKPSKRISVKQASKYQEAPDEVPGDPTIFPYSAYNAPQFVVVKESASIASIHRLPPEILTEIFRWITQGRPPSRNLASVCKGWEELLQQTPGFWSNIRVRFHEAEHLQELQRIRRRIELSQSALLDVEMNISTGIGGVWGLEIFELVLDTGIERWRSLTVISCGENSISNELSSRLSGRYFSALRYLTVYDGRYRSNGLVSAIGVLLVQSKPRIEELDINGNLPRAYTNAEVLKYVRRVKMPAYLASRLQGLSSLQEIDVQGLVDAKSFPPLPCRAKFEFLQRDSLKIIQIAHLRHLEVEKWLGTCSEPIIELPELISLSFGDGSLLNVTNILASNLQILKVTDSPGQGDIDYMVITAIINRSPVTVFVRPTHLTLQTKMPAQNLLRVLKNWSQVLHLTLVLDYQSIKHSFFEIFVQAEETLCPDLINLRLDAESLHVSDEVEKWDGMAREIHRSRENLPLEYIAWRLRPHAWHLI